MVSTKKTLHPKNPDPSKVAILMTLTLAIQVRSPLDWRVLWFLGCKQNPHKMSLDSKLPCFRWICSTFHSSIRYTGVVFCPSLANGGTIPTFGAPKSPKSLRSYLPLKLSRSPKQDWKFGQLSFLLPWNKLTIVNVSCFVMIFCKKKCSWNSPSAVLFKRMLSDYRIQPMANG